MDVTPSAKECGSKYPVYMSAAAFSNFVEVPKGVVGQDKSDRLWDNLWKLRLTIRNNPTQRNPLRFNVAVRNDNRAPSLVWFRAVGARSLTKSLVILMLVMLVGSTCIIGFGNKKSEKPERLKPHLLIKYGN